MKKSILIFSAILLAFAGCTKPQEEDEKTYGISISRDKVQFSCGQDETESISVECEADWNVEGYTEGMKVWLQIDRLSGSGNASVNLKTVDLNPYGKKRMAVLRFVCGKASKTLLVTQLHDPERTISISPDTLSFDNQTGTDSIIVNTTKQWYLDSLTSPIPSWLKVEPKSGTGQAKVYVSTISPNDSKEPRKCTLDFRIIRGSSASLYVIQDRKALEEKIISWTGNKDTQTITAPSGAAYGYFPYTTGSDPSKNPTWTDGPDGATQFTGYFQAVRDYVFKMDSLATVGTSYTLELGPSADESKWFYGNLQVHGYVGIRCRNTYVKIPAIPGYVLSGIKVLCGNGTDKASSITIGTDNKIKSSSTVTAANVLEGKAQLTIGKPTPVDLTFTKTAVNTPYYLFVVQDRLITGFTFKYSEVETK